LRDRVPQLCQKYQKPIQNPNTTVDPGEKWYFLLLPKVATEQDILALENKAQGAELAENWDLAEQLWIRCVAATGGEDLNALDGYARVRWKKANQRSTTPNPPPQQSQQNTRSAATPKPPEPPPKPKQPSFSFEIITVDATGRETQRKPGTANYFREDLGDGIALDMVQIPGGRFMMGAAKTGLLGKKEEGASDDEFPQHEVTIAPFWMGKFTVTQAQWKAVSSFSKVKVDLNSDPSNFKGANRPVEQVSWEDAIEFCDRLSRKTGKTFSLPSEAQWEYACRAGTTTPFHFGETITTDLANFQGTDWEYNGTTYPGNYAKAPKGEYRQQTIYVGSFPPNAFGLYDMHGNVWEWCLDTWHGSYDRAPSNGSAWVGKDEKYRLIRGGSWYSIPHHCRSAHRNYLAPADRDGDLGFRVCYLPS
jgi:formylglycine-generating enzyme required for sulfatase activity